MIGLFYYTLGNINPKFRSATQTIQLLTVEIYFYASFRATQSPVLYFNDDLWAS